MTQRNTNTPDYADPTNCYSPQRRAGTKPGRHNPEVTIKLRHPQTRQLKAWLAKHPRFHLHFTPASSSWLNLVERWFRELTDKAIRRGVFHSVPDLIAAIEDYLAAHNNEPKPLVWTATAESILEKVARGRVALQTVNQN